MWYIVIVIDLCIFIELSMVYIYYVVIFWIFYLIKIRFINFIFYNMEKNVK